VIHYLTFNQLAHSLSNHHTIEGTGFFAGSAEYVTPYFHCEISNDLGFSLMKRVAQGEPRAVKQFKTYFGPLTVSKYKIVKAKLAETLCVDISHSMYERELT